MNSDQFISALVEHVHAVAIEGTLSQLEGPSGRSTPKKLVRAATWYAGLAGDDKANLKSVIEVSVHGALFGLLCTLDGIRIVQENPEHQFQLLSVEYGASTQLNDLDSELLHDKYQAVVYSRVFE